MQQPEMGGNQSGPSMKQSMLTFGLLAIQMLVVDDPSVKGHLQAHTQRVLSQKA